MMVTRLKLMLNRQEYSALYRAAREELRSPADEARHIVRRELEKRGLLRTNREQAGARAREC
jgi:hypothetical protein